MDFLALDSQADNPEGWKSVDTYFDWLVVQSIFPLLLLSTVLDIFFFWHKWVTLEGKGRVYDLINHGWLLVLLCFVSWAWKAKKGHEFIASRGQGHAFLFCLACLLTLVASISYQIHPNPYYQGIMTALMLASGLILLSKVWVTVTLTLVVLCWSTSVIGSKVSTHDLIGFYTAAVVSIFCVKVRRDIYRDQLELMCRKQLQSRELEWALTTSNESRVELDKSLVLGERKLSEIQQELESASVHRRLLEEQLSSSKKFDALGRLAGGVAHDFNNLLAIIKLNSECLAGEVGPEAAKSLQGVDTAASRAASITTQLLAFSRRQVMAKRPISAKELLSDSWKVLSALVGENIHTGFRLDCPDLMVEADPSQIHQLLLNLVVNASDAMPNGGCLSLLATARPEGLLLELQDSGQGFEPELKRRIFEPFYTTKEVGEATGLGLAMVQGIVRQHGGEISATGALGEGATFRVLLPEYLPQVNSEADQACKVRSSEEPLIMVVDDEPALRRLLERYLQRQGYRVLVASDGEEAYRIWGECRTKPDILLTDVRMPGLDGPALARKLSNDGYHPPLFFMSGYTDSRIEEAGFHPNDYTFLSKPFALSDIKSVLESLLGVPA